MIDKPSHLPQKGMYFTLPLEQFVRVAKAKRVRLQLDGVDFELTDPQLKRVKALAKELK